MKKSLIFIISILGIFFSSLLTNNLNAQTATVTITYTGFQACGGCTVCGADYWCFNTVSSWCGNTAACGTQSFTDPVPAGNIITNISIDYFSAGCGSGSMTGDVNGSVFPTVNDANTGCLCSNAPCNVAATTGATFPCGIPNYNYGTLNNFQLCTGLDVCINAAVLTFTYVPANQASPATQPSPISGNASICAGATQTYTIPPVANATSYTWTVPAGWTINSGQGTTGLTATPGSSGTICVTATNLCGTSAATCFNVTVNAIVTPTFTQVAPICSGDALANLSTTSTNGITGTWSPAMNNTATTLYTFTPTAGLCATTTTMTITVNPNVTPTFTQVAAICSGGALANLPTTSTNGITGTWSPAMNNTATTLYTFTPTAGLCATTTTMTITVNPNVTPTFTQVAAICSGDALANLPTTSTNGITGTWSPAMNNTATTLYTFTPTAGLCATTTTMTITVNPNVTPTFTQVAAICSGGALANLPTTSTNGITGTWSPVMNNTATTLYTFTPTAGLCATTTTMTITVNPTPIADAPVNIAACDSFILPALTVGNYFNTTGGVGPIAVGTVITTTQTIFVYAESGTTPNCIDENSFTITITISPNAGTDSTLGICATGNPVDLFTLLGAADVGGTWVPIMTSGTGVFDPAVDPAATYQYIVTGTAPCADDTADVVVTITANDDPTFIYPDFCAGSGGIPGVINTPGGTFTYNPNPGDGSAINPTTGIITNGVGGSTYDIQYLTPTGACQDSLTITVNVGTPVNAGTDNTLPACITGGTTDLFTLLGGADAGGTWVPVMTSGTGVFDPTVDPAGTYQYVLTGTNGCPDDTADVVVTITNNDDPTFSYPDFCAGDGGLPGVINTPGGTFSYNPNPGDGSTIDPTTGIIAGAVVGATYDIQYLTPTGTCQDSLTITVNSDGVTAVINATPLTGAIPLNVFFGNGSTTGAGITYSWDFGDGNTSILFEPNNIYITSGIYTVILIVTDGNCSDTISLVIDAFGESVILIPNVFTPNGDGSNDVFTVKGINLESVEGEIYNRWGQKMFSWNNVRGHWDGRTLSGSEAPAGTYFYIITAEGIDGTEYFKKGGFSLIR